MNSPKISEQKITMNYEPCRKTAKSSFSDPPKRFQTSEDVAKNFQELPKKVPRSFMTLQNVSRTAFKTLPSGHMERQKLIKTSFRCQKPPNKFSSVSKTLTKQEKVTSKIVNSTVRKPFACRPQHFFHNRVS